MSKGAPSSEPLEGYDRFVEIFGQYTNGFSDSGPKKDFIAESPREFATPLRRRTATTPRPHGPTFIRSTLESTTLFHAIATFVARKLAIDHGWMSATQQQIPPEALEHIKTPDNMMAVLKLAAPIHSFLYEHIPKAVDKAFSLLYTAALAHVDYTIGLREKDISIDAVLRTWTAAEMTHLKSSIGRRPAWTKAGIEREVRTAVAYFHRTKKSRVPTLSNIATWISKREPEKALTGRALGQLMKRKHLDWKELRKRSE